MFGNVWRTGSIPHSSPVDSILDDYDGDWNDETFHRLMAQDDLVQECRYNNTRLFEFLSLAKYTAKLLRYVTQGVPDDEPLPPNDDADGDEDTPSDASPVSSSESAEQVAVLQQCKYPFVAAEIFCAGRDEIMDTLFRPENELLMDELFAFLQKAAPLDPVLSGYFSKVVCALLASRSNELHAYFERHMDILTNLVQHISSDSILEVLLRVMHGPPEDSSYGGAVDMARHWVAKTDVVQKLVDVLGHDHTSCSVCPNDFSNAAEALCSIAALSSTSPLFVQLYSEGTVRSLLNKFGLACDELLVLQCSDEESKEPSPFLTCDSKPFGHKSSSVVHILTVLQRLVLSSNSVPGGALGGMMGGSGGGAGSCQPPTIILPSTVTPSAASHTESVLVLLLPDIISQLACILNNSKPKNGLTACSLKTSYNSTLAPPLGTVRLKVIEFVRVLISTGHSTIIDALVSHNMFNAILDLCFTYEWHNVMHISVMAIVEMTFSLNNSGQRGDLHLLQPVDQGGCGLLQRLLDGFQSKRNRELAVRGERSKTVDAPSAIQGGADGIMIKIAKTINRAAAADDDVAALLSIEPRWVAFVDTALTAANVLENHSLGGRRPSAANQLVGLSFMRYVQPQEEEASPVDLNEIMSAFARNGAGWAADAPGGSVEPTSPEFNAYAYWSQPVFDAFAPPPKVVEAADQFADQHMATPRSRKKT